jgi:hypothetical protein
MVGMHLTVAVARLLHSRCIRTARSAPVDTRRRQHSRRTASVATQWLCGGRTFCIGTVCAQHLRPGQRAWAADPRGIPQNDIGHFELVLLVAAWPCHPGVVGHVLTVQLRDPDEAVKVVSQHVPEAVRVE